jgi:hypothetical protein
MISFLPRPMRVAALLIALGALSAVPGSLVAQSHVVSQSEVQEQVLAASQTRQHNQDTVTQFLSSPEAAKAVSAAGMDPDRVKAAVPTLNDEELAQIVSRAEKAQADFAAGTMGQRDLLLIIVAIAVLILIIVAVR